MLSKHLALSSILSALSQIVLMLQSASVTLWHKPTHYSPFSIQLNMSNFSMIRITFRPFFTWTALGDENLRFSLMLVRQPNVVA